MLSGWITAFCAFSFEGDFAGPEPEPRNSFERGWSQSYVLDKVRYPTIDYDDSPAGDSEVEVKIFPNQEEAVETLVIAGNMGMKMETREETRGALS
jgi:Domain of unknown function (DUF4419)